MILGIDTAVRRRVAVATVDDRGQVLTRVEMRGPGVAAGLTEAIRNAAAADDLTAVVVVTGPGSYTGLRSGMAAALGVSQARDVPLYGVATLEMVAGAAPPAAVRIRAVSDAGRGGVFVADFQRIVGTQQLTLVSEPRRTELAELADLPPQASGHADYDVVVSTDDLGAPGWLLVDGLDALAQALPLAVRRQQLTAAGLHPGYVTLTRFTEVKPRV